MRIESGEGDDERKGHSFGEVNVNSNNAPVHRRRKLTAHRSHSLDGDVSVIGLGSGMEPSWNTYGPNVGEMDIHSPVIPVRRT